MGVAKGIGAMKDAQKKIKSSMENSGGRYIGIGDTEKFLFRFMLDQDDLVNGYFHRVPMEQSGRTWTQDVLCLGEGCPYCASDNKDISKKSYKFITWVWVYYKLHAKADDEGKWEPEEAEDGSTFYKETINKPMLLKQGYYFSRLLTAIAGKYSTLIDRDYECVRSGTGLDTSYSLFPEDKKAMGKKIKEAIKGLDDIEAILNGESKSSESKSKKSVAEEFSEDEDEDEDDF